MQRLRLVRRVCSRHAIGAHATMSACNVYRKDRLKMRTCPHLVKGNLSEGDAKQTGK